MHSCVYAIVAFMRVRNRRSHAASAILAAMQLSATAQPRGCPQSSRPCGCPQLRSHAASAIVRSCVSAVNLRSATSESGSRRPAHFPRIFSVLNYSRSANANATKIFAPEGHHARWTYKKTPPGRQAIFFHLSSSRGAAGLFSLTVSYLTI